MGRLKGKVAIVRGEEVHLRIPNELTAETLEKSKKGEDVYRFSNVDELLKELHKSGHYQN